MAQFEQQAQQDLYVRAAAHLASAFGDLIEPIEDEAAFIVELGPTNLLVTVDADGPDHASMMIYSLFGEGIMLTPAVADYLARKAYEVPLTNLSIRHDDTVVLRQVILGEAVTRETLIMMIGMFARSCHEIDDELTRRYR